MKVYIASAFSLIEKVQAACDRLEEEGHEITVKWWTREYDILGEGKVKTTTLKERYNDLEPDKFYLLPETERSYDADFNGVLEASAFLFVADDEARAYNGANIELGIALGGSKHCFSIGKLSNSVLYFEVVQCSSIEEVLNHLRYLEYDLTGDPCIFEGNEGLCGYNGECIHRDGRTCYAEDNDLLTWEDYQLREEP